MYRILLVVIGAVIVMRVASSDAKHAPARREASRVASVQPLPPPPPPPQPALEVMVDEEAIEEEPDDPAVHTDPDADTEDGIDLDVAFEMARVATSPNGAIQGVVRDSRTGDSIPGVTVVLTSPALQGAQAVITDDNGGFRLTELPSGSYVVTLYYLDTTVEYAEIAIRAGKTTPFFHAIATDVRPIIIDPPPTIEDYGQGITIDAEYTKTIPVPERTFESALGSLGDEGISFSGGTSLENTYYVDEQPVDPCEVIE